MWRHSLGSRAATDSEVKLGKDSEMGFVDGALPTKARDTTTTMFVSECLLPTKRGNFLLRAYKHEGNGRSLEPVVMIAVSD